jgi:phage terminase large subunit-like protein
MPPTNLAAQLTDALENSWSAKARPNQQLPPGDWAIWMLLAGRGFGKTRVLSETANSWATSGQYSRIGCAARSFGRVECRNGTVRPLQLPARCLINRPVAPHRRRRQYPRLTLDHDSSTGRARPCA